MKKEFAMIGSLFLLAVLLAAVFVANDEPDDPKTTTTSTVAVAETMAWTIGGGVQGTVTLTGELPNGYPTETFLNDQLLGSDPDGDFAWDLDMKLPSPVSLQDDMDCDQLAFDFAFWTEGALRAIDDGILDSAARQAAYAQNALVLQTVQGCGT